MNTNKPIGVLFVCLGNICRSPTANIIFNHKIANKNYSNQITVDSAGTAAYHVGNSPDTRMQQACLAKNYNMSALRARQFELADFYKFDYIVAMDKENLANIVAMQPLDYAGKVVLMLEIGDGLTSVAPTKYNQEVFDPYFGGQEGFNGVVTLLENSVDNLIKQIEIDKKWNN